MCGDQNSLERKLQGENISLSMDEKRIIVVKTLTPGPSSGRPRVCYVYMLGLKPIQAYLVRPDPFVKYKFLAETAAGDRNSLGCSSANSKSRLLFPWFFHFQAVKNLHITGESN